MDEDKLRLMRTTLLQFGDIPSVEWDEAVRLFKPLSLDQGDYYIRQGDNPSRMAFILSGVLRVFCINDAGEDRTLSFRTTGQFIAAYTPHIEKRETWYSIEALTDCDLVYLSLKQTDDLIANHPCWEKVFQNYIVRLFIEKEDRERSFLMEDAKTRYLNFRKSFPDIEQQIHQFHIASFLGISPVSLSRIRADLKKSQ